MADRRRRDSKAAPFSRLLESVSAEYEKVGRWNENLQKDLPKSWEKHGDLVLLPHNSFSLQEWRMLGRNLWNIVAECLQSERVGRKRRIEDDDYRTPHVELLHGRHGWVEHVDNGITYNYDVTKCMFSIGNIGEKLRIAGFDCKGETVVDLFTGIGYFTLPYLVHAKAALVHACEWNPDALEALQKNLIANKVEDRCVIHEGDCRKECPIGVADRVNMGLLPTARAYWLTACKALKPTGGVLHVHENVTSSKLKVRAASMQESEGSSGETPPSGALARKYSQAHGHGEELTPTSDSGRKLGNRPSAEGPKLTGQCSVDSVDPAVGPTERKDSLLEEEEDTYYPPIHDNFLSDWTSGKLDRAWKQFSIAAARRIRRFLNNLHEDEWGVTITRVGKVKSYGPRIDHVVLDLACKPGPPWA